MNKLNEELLEQIYHLSNDKGLKNDICNNFDHLRSIDKYRLSMFFDIFKIFQLIVYSIGNFDYRNTGTLLRNTLEDVAIVKHLCQDEKLLEAYVEHKKFSLSISDLTDRRSAIIKHYDLDKKCDPYIYLDYGWYEEIKRTGNYGISTIIRDANLESINEWKKTFNSFVHGGIHNLNVNINCYDEYMEELIYIAGTLFDETICLYHNLTNYSFYIDEIHNYKTKFVEIFEKITKNRSDNM